VPEGGDLPPEEELAALEAAEAEAAAAAAAEHEQAEAVIAEVIAEEEIEEDVEEGVEPEPPATESSVDAPESPDDEDGPAAA